MISGGVEINSLKFVRWLVQCFLKLHHQMVYEEGPVCKLCLEGRDINIVFDISFH